MRIIDVNACMEMAAVQRPTAFTLHLHASVDKVN